MNPDSKIDSVIYERLRKEAEAKAEGTDYTVDEMLALRAVSEGNHFSEELVRAHSTMQLLKKKRSFYHWAMTLYRVHLRSAVPIPPVDKDSAGPSPLYIGFHGVLYPLERDMGFYFGPLSTSMSKAVADTIVQGDGQILEVRSSYANPLK